MSEERQFGNATVTVTIRGRRCPACDESEFEMRDCLVADLAIAKALIALGSRDPRAFTFCRKVVGIGIPTMKERLGTTTEALALYKATGHIQPDWWQKLAAIVAAAQVQSYMGDTIPPLPPCRGSFRSE